MRRCALVVGQLSLGQRRSISPPQDRHRTFPRATVSGGPPRCPRRQVSPKWRRHHRWGRGSRCCRARGFQTSMSWWTLASPPRPPFVGSVRVAGCRGRNCGRTNGASQPQLGKRRVAGRRKSHTHKICVYRTWSLRVALATAHIYQHRMSSSASSGRRQPHEHTSKMEVPRYPGNKSSPAQLGF